MVRLAPSVSVTHTHTHTHSLVCNVLPHCTCTVNNVQLTSSHLILHVTDLNRLMMPHYLSQAANIRRVKLPGVGFSLS